MVKRIRNRHFLLKCLLVSVVFMAAVVSGPLLELIPAKEVKAAASTTTIVNFTNKSGRYLEKINSDWYLKNSGGQALTGVQYLSVPCVDGLLSGFYMFDNNGKLLRKAAVYYLKKQTVARVVFQGYHITSSTGRFLSSPRGLVYLKKYTCQGRTFSGVYYLGDHGRLSSSAQMRKIAAKKVGGVSFATGYYYFDKYGKLCTTVGFHYLNQTVGGHHYWGTYYFGGAHGALYQKAGWITFNNKKYLLSYFGRRYQNCWRQGYYLLSDGTIAKDQQVPDGSYVDSDGRKCAKEEMQLSGLKKSLKNMTDGYSGTWSVYVKNLKTGDVVNLNEKAMFPASVIKAFVMASTFDQIYKKKLSYNTTVKSLLKQMITVSDNEAYNQLVRLNSASGNFVSGAATVNAYLKMNGYTKTECHTTLHPASSSYSSDGGSNTSSAKDCGVLLEKIYNGTCVSAAYSKEMLNLLLGQTRTWKIPMGVPAGIKTANKTGETSTVQHDMAVVYGKKTTYVICVFSSGVSEYNGINGIKNISRYVYNYLNS